MPGLVRRLLPPAALIAIAAAIFGQVRSHAFLLNWDDLAYVVENEIIRGLSWDHVRAAFAAPYFQNYAPLHLLSYAVDYSLWGLDAGAFLLVNVALHGLNGALLFALLRRLGISAGGAFVGAALFIVHPVQVESVAWVSERKNLLSMGFSLGALHAFVSYRTAAARGARVAAYLGALALAVAALLAKAIAVVLPALLLLVDAGWFDRTRRRTRIVDKLPFVAAAAALAIATLASQRDAVGEGRGVFGMSPMATVYTMIPIVARYLGMVFWPSGLAAVYTPEIRHGPDAPFAAAVLLLAVLSAAGWILWRRVRRAFCWYAAFFVGLVPVLHIVPLPTLMNDRYLYFPMLGAAGLAAFAVDHLLARGGIARRAAAPAAVLALVALGIASFTRTSTWRDDLTLWRDAAEKTPRATRAWVNLGMACVDAGRLEEAVPAFQRGLAGDPYHPLALNNLAGAYNQLGRPVEARALLVRAIQVEPQSFNAHMNLGLACKMMGDLACAEQAFLAAARIRPDAPGPRVELREVLSDRAASGAPRE